MGHHGHPLPFALGQFLDPANDRFVVRLYVEQRATAAEQWRVYKLSTGEPLALLEPRTQMPDDERIHSILAAWPIAGTPLTLVHWYRADYSLRMYLFGALVTPDMHFGAVFTLIDLAGRVVWSQELPDDYTAGGDMDAHEALLDEMREGGALLETREPGRFELRHVAEDLLVTYEVRKVDDVEEPWEVCEVEHQRYEAAPKSVSSTAVETERPVELQHLGTTVLGSSEPYPWMHIHDVRGFDVDGQGRVGFVRGRGVNDTRCDFVLIEPSGALVAEIPFPEPPQGERWDYRVAWTAGQRWIAAGSETLAHGRARAWWLDLASESWTAVEDFELPQLDALAGAPDGGFVALGETLEQYGMLGSLASFDALGRRRRASGFSSSYHSGDPAHLSSPRDVTATTSGEIVVVDGDGSTLHLFDADLHYLRTIDLAGAWGSRPGRPRAVDADSDGGWLVYDSNGGPQVGRMDREGEVVAAFALRFPDGRALARHGDVRVGPQSELWTSQWHSLVRLDAQGVVQNVLESAPDLEVLSDSARIELGPDDRIYALDARTGAVHVFLPDGSPQHVCKPDPQDFDQGIHWRPQLSIHGSGQVFVAARFRGPQAVLHFAAEGTRLGAEPRSGSWLFQPTTGKRWSFFEEKLLLHSSNGELVRETVRGPDGSWLHDVEVAAVAPDGTLALGTDPDHAPAVVHLYSAEGDPIRTLPQPAGLKRELRFDFDGERLAFGIDAEPGAAPSVQVIDAKGGVPLRFRPDRRFRPQRRVAFWQPFFARGGKELWLFDGARTIERYGFP